MNGNPTVRESPWHAPGPQRQSTRSLQHDGPLPAGLLFSLSRASSHASTFPFCIGLGLCLCLCHCLHLPIPVHYLSSLLPLPLLSVALPLFLTLAGRVVGRYCTSTRLARPPRLVEMAKCQPVRAMGRQAYGLRCQRLLYCNEGKVP